MKGFVGYLCVFLVLIGAIIIWGSYDTITPMVAQAEAEMAVGAQPLQLIMNSATLIVKIIGGAAFTGIAAAIFTEGRKAYKVWMRNGRTKRWAPGPNAQFKAQAPRVPSLKREDLMLLALMGKNANGPLINSRLGSIRTQSNDDDDALDLEF